MKASGTRTKHIAGPSAKLVSDGNNNCTTGSIDNSSAHKRQGKNTKQAQVCLLIKEINKKIKKKNFYNPSDSINSDSAFSLSLSLSPYLFVL